MLIECSVLACYDTNCMFNLLFQGPAPLQTRAWICPGTEPAVGREDLWLLYGCRNEKADDERGQFPALINVPSPINGVQHLPATATGVPVWNWDLLVVQDAHITFSSAFLQQWRCSLQFWPVWFETLPSQFQKCWVLRWGNYASI